MACGASDERFEGSLAVATNVGFPPKADIGDKVGNQQAQEAKKKGAR